MMTCLPGQVISQNQEEIYNWKNTHLGIYTTKDTSRIQTSGFIPSETNLVFQRYGKHVCYA